MKLQATRTSLPTHDYTLARQHAVSWLGDRYLLAAPINVDPRIGRMRHARAPRLYVVEQPPDASNGIIVLARSGGATTRS